MKCSVRGPDENSLSGLFHANGIGHFISPHEGFQATTHTDTDTHAHNRDSMRYNFHHPPPVRHSHRQSCKVFLSRKCLVLAGCTVPRVSAVSRLPIVATVASMLLSVAIAALYFVAVAAVATVASMSSVSSMATMTSMSSMAAVAAVEVCLGGLPYKTIRKTCKKCHRACLTVRSKLSREDAYK